MKRPFFIIFILSLMISTNLHAQDEKVNLFPLQETVRALEDESFYEYCFFHDFISKNNHGLSFVVTRLYNSDLSRMIPLVVLAGLNPKDENLDMLQIFTVGQAKEVVKYLEYLRLTSENHPKGIHRVFNGPEDFRIISYDAGRQYKITVICKGDRYGSYIASKRELSDWIEAFHECMDHIEGLDK